jgi:hypothetical protein
MPLIVSIEHAVAMLHVGANASAKVLEH